MGDFDLFEGILFEKTEIIQALVDYARSMGVDINDQERHMLDVHGLGSNRRRETGCMLQLKLKANYVRKHLKEPSE